MSLRLDVFKLMSFSLLNSLVLKLLGVASFYIIVRALPRTDIGLIGVVGGYAAILGFLSLGPESALVRDFPKIKDSINKHLSAYMKFWAYRTVLIMAVSLGLGLWVWHYYQDVRFFLYMVGIAVSVNLNLFEQIITELFYVDFKQQIVLKVNLVIKLVFLALLFSLFWQPDVLLYLGILVGIDAVSAGTWIVLLFRRYHFRFTGEGARNILRWNLMDYSLWAHLSNSFNTLVYKIDTLVLSFFAALAAIGNYTIALEIAGFFFIIPRLLQKSVIVGTVNLQNTERLNEVIFIFVKYFALLSVAQLAFFLIAGPWIVSIFTDIAVQEIYLYALLMLVGVSVLNVVRPISTLINTHASMRKGFFWVYLPGSLIGVAAYALGAAWYGPLGVAAANIVAYSVLAVLIVVFVHRVVPLKPTFSLMSDIERGLLKDLRTSKGGLEDNTPRKK
ncbi:MAG: hypothetical protein HY369_03145 [Candidatus Aenigmarchaeota archaeon]|nr:hypothetical protein [Candidatus Aenigmarchaeota archaeon]